MACIQDKPRHECECESQGEARGGVREQERIANCATYCIFKPVGRETAQSQALHTYALEKVISVRRASKIKLLTHVELTQALRFQFLSFIARRRH